MCQRWLYFLKKQPHQGLKKSFSFSAPSTHTERCRSLEGLWTDFEQLVKNTRLYLRADVRSFKMNLFHFEVKQSSVLLIDIF